MHSSSITSNHGSRGRNLSGGLTSNDEHFSFHLDGVPPYGEVIIVFLVNAEFSFDKKNTIM